MHSMEIKTEKLPKESTQRRTPRRIHEQRKRTSESLTLTRNSPPLIYRYGYSRPGPLSGSWFGGAPASDAPKKIAPQCIGCFRRERPLLRRKRPPSTLRRIPRGTRIRTIRLASRKKRGICSSRRTYRCRPNARYAVMGECPARGGSGAQSLQSHWSACGSILMSSRMHERW